MSMSSAVLLHTANDCETLLSDSQQLSRARAAANATGSTVGRAIRGPDYQVAENRFSTA
jgi:hypothetical protein